MQPQWFYLALAIDIGAFLSLLARSGETAAFMALFLLHITACALMAAVLFPALPTHYRTQKTATIALLFGLAFMAPIFGPLGVVLLVRLNLAGHQSDLRPQPLQTLDLPTFALPEFDLGSKESVRAAQNAIRSRLAQHVPEHLRLQSLLTLQAVPQTVANPILVDLLADENDDIRLVAFGMLDAREKNLSQHIQAEQKKLANAATAGQRYASLCNLAALHWELVYLSLAQKELRQHMLETAFSYVQQARQFPESSQDGQLTRLEARILMALGHHRQARAMFERSLELGQPKTAVLPYLAELAYLDGDYGQVRKLLGELSSHDVKPALRMLIDLWSGRNTTRVFRDRRILPHL